MGTSILSQIMAGDANHVDIPFPGHARYIRLRVVSCQETLDATLAADQLFKSSKIDVSFQNVNAYENEKNMQLLFRACVDPETGEPISESIREFRCLITNEIRSALIDEYNGLISTCDPSPLKMDGAEFDQLVESLKKNPAETIGRVSSFRMQRKLLLSLVEELLNLQKDNGHTSL